MAKRFKKKKNYLFIVKLSIIISIIYFSFSIIYNTLYKYYLKKLTTKDFINDMISSKETDVDKYLSPQYILKYTFDINKDNTIPVSDNKTANNNQIYIYNTHNNEKYYDSYLENYNILPDVKTASYILKDYLEEKGISTYVEENNPSDILKKNNWSYDKSYDASRTIVEQRIKSNNYQMIFDLHRDSSFKEKTTLNYQNKQFAKFLFVIGTGFTTYENNYQIASKINDKLNSKVPDISKGIIKKSGPGVNGIYNEDLSPNLVLIELGGQYNEIEELNNSLLVLSEVIEDIIKENKNEKQ